MKKEALVRRMLPCPAYDVEAIESWLTDLAEEGLMLEKLGWTGLLFRSGPPQKVRYRLIADPKSPKGKHYMGSPDLPAPPQEMEDITESLGWERVVTYGRFYIYRTAAPEAPELETDPKVQAIAMGAVIRWEAARVWLTALSVFLYCIAWGRPSSLAEHPFLFAAAVVLLWFLLCSLWDMVCLRRLTRRLKSGEEPNHRKPWRKWANLHRTLKVVNGLLFLFVLACAIVALCTGIEVSVSLEPPQ